MPQFRVDKLVRDKILGLMQSEGQDLEYKTLTGKDLQRALLTKLKEEADEALAVLDDDKELMIELTDIKEVFETFVETKGLQMADIEKAQTTKRDTKGGLSAGYFVEKITLASSDQWVQYYGNRPLQYQEIFESSDEPEGQFDMPYVEPDLYQHFKGHYYEVIGVGCQAETLEYLVIYRSLYQKGNMPTFWLRPYDLFIDRVEVNGNTIPRFRRIGQ